MDEWVAVGVSTTGRLKAADLSPVTMKALGPFATADEAREACNRLGMPQIQWTVVVLMDPSPTSPH